MGSNVAECDEITLSYTANNFTPHADDTLSYVPTATETNTVANVVTLASGTDYNLSGTTFTFSRNTFSVVTGGHTITIAVKIGANELATVT